MLNWLQTSLSDVQNSLANQMSKFTTPEETLRQIKWGVTTLEKFVYQKRVYKSWANNIQGVLNEKTITKKNFEGWLDNLKTNTMDRITTVDCSRSEDVRNAQFDVIFAKKLSSIYYPE